MFLSLFFDSHAFENPSLLIPFAALSPFCHASHEVSTYVI